MRNAGPERPAVWVNVSDPDFQDATPNAQGGSVSNTLARTDNAMFLAREDRDYVLLPPQVLQSDALVTYQGQAAAFAYDGPVLWREFGPGAIHSRASWDAVVSFDARSANSESSALHEGVADLIAAMTGQVAIDIPCGGDLYLALANTSQRDRQRFDFTLAVEPADSCPVDAGTPPPPLSETKSKTRLQTTEGSRAGRWR